MADIWPLASTCNTPAYIPLLTHKLLHVCLFFLKSCFCKKELIGLEILVQTHTRAGGYTGQKPSPGHTCQVFQDGVTGQPPNTDGFTIRAKDELFIFLRLTYAMGFSFECGKGGGCENRLGALILGLRSGLRFPSS